MSSSSQPSLPPPSFSPVSDSSAPSSDAPPVVPRFEYTRTGRNKGKPSDPLMRVGGQYVRTVEMFILPSVIMTSGLVRESAPEDQEYTHEENRKWDVWQLLIELHPTILDACRSQQTMKDAAHLLQLGATSVKAFDTNGVKTNLPMWWNLVKGDLGPIPTDKHKRGFGDPTCGMLLCPVELDWTDDEVKKHLQAETATINGVAVDGSDWPCFLHSTPIDRTHPWMTFLRGPLLIKAYRHVFTSPSSARAAVDADTTTATTKVGNAQLYGMTTVTKASIAYVATQVLFALTSLPTFNKNHRSLDAITFYNSLIDYLHDPVFHSKNVQLLKWWNLQIFPRSAVYARAKASSAHQRMKDALMASADPSPETNEGAAFGQGNASPPVA